MNHAPDDIPGLGPPPDVSWPSLIYLSEREAAVIFICGIVGAVVGAWQSAEDGLVFAIGAAVIGFILGRSVALLLYSCWMQFRRPLLAASLLALVACGSRCGAEPTNNTSSALQSAWGR